MNTVLKLPSAVLLLAFTCASAIAQSSLVHNGGFNLSGGPPGDSSGWWHVNGIGTTWNNRPERLPVNADFELDEGGMIAIETIYQDVPTTQGQAYELAVVFHTAREPTDLQIQWGNVVFEPVPAIGHVWQRASFQVSAESETTRLSLIAGPRHEGALWLDSVSLVAIPEPSTLSLLGSGLLFAGIFFERNRVKALTKS